jgi:hypothetical protein
MVVDVRKDRRIMIGVNKISSQTDAAWMFGTLGIQRCDGTGVTALAGRYDGFLLH